MSTPEGFIFKEKVAELSELILSKHPRMPLLLSEIHKTLKAYPENVTLLEESDLAIIVSGLKVQTGVEFASAAIKGGGSKSATAAIKKLGADAF
mgnify:FL=1